jgi:hypothetical protein
MHVRVIRVMKHETRCNMVGLLGPTAAQLNATAPCAAVLQQQLIAHEALTEQQAADQHPP